MKAATPNRSDGVDDSGEDLQPQVAERAAAGRGTGGEPDRQQCQADPGDVGEHVAGVGQECQAVREERPDELDEEDAERQREDGNETRTVRGRGRHVRMRHQGCLPAAERAHALSTRVIAHASHPRVAPLVMRRCEPHDIRAMTVVDVARA